ncbi:PREDICTED: uncharacterized protein LOC109214067 [Nicotiana attenuata]|uniref:uncharacterized protein LOC109214067 n=1 Tax=Nicotiana attenuata TaxID=49451 RepID=UPI000905A97E|nr:PREDICTED: uncharacterized protein LOC109214067 [Nicotiana attenuata]
MYRMNFEGDELVEEEDEEDSDEEEETESSIDLLMRLVGSMFKKVSKRARKATRSILPDVIPPQLKSRGGRDVLEIKAVCNEGIKVHPFDVMCSSLTRVLHPSSHNKT